MEGGRKRGVVAETVPAALDARAYQVLFMPPIASPADWRMNALRAVEVCVICGARYTTRAHRQIVGTRRAA